MQPEMSPEDGLEHKYIEVNDGPIPSMPGWDYQGIVNIEGVAHWHWTRPSPS